MSTLKQNGTIAMLSKTDLLEKISTYEGTLEEFMEEVRAKYGYIEVQLWDDDYCNEGES